MLLCVYEFLMIAHGQKARGHTISKVYHDDQSTGDFVQLSSQPAFQLLSSSLLSRSRRPFDVCSYVHYVPSIVYATHESLQVFLWGTHETAGVEWVL